MKAILEFDFHEEREEFRQASDATAMAAALFDITEFIWSKLRDDELPEETEKAIKSVYDGTLRILDSYGVDRYVL